MKINVSVLNVFVFLSGALSLATAIQIRISSEQQRDLANELHQKMVEYHRHVIELECEVTRAKRRIEIESAAMRHPIERSGSVVNCSSCPGCDQ